MTVNYKVTGAQRKELVKVISDTMGTKAKYLGTPSMAYQIGFFTVSKEGILSWEEADEQTLKQVLEAIASAGFEGEMPQEIAEEKAEEPEQMEQTEEDQDSAAEQTEEPEETKESEPIAETPDVAPEFAQESETEQVEQLPTEMENPQESENSAPRCMEENAENKAESNADTLTISMPKAEFTPAALDNLCRIVKSKESLIKKALGAESLPIQMNEEEISFPWFTFSDYFGCAPQAKAYGHFICALCDMAKNSKRITAKEKHIDNEKYAFRCFLLRLGFIGDEYKQERRILLSNLSGSSAFRQTPAQENTSAQEVDAE